ncbi:hypothetical protein HY990_05845 [Candidatus Micrarchaeota archaeon]|nr:hypothetical protein [Candidatus Micrarchaeota archaeon]
MQLKRHAIIAGAVLSMTASCEYQRPRRSFAPMQSIQSYDVPPRRHARRATPVVTESLEPDPSLSLSNGRYRVSSWSFTHFSERSQPQEELDALGISRISERSDLPPFITLLRGASHATFVPSGRTFFVANIRAYCGPHADACTHNGGPRDGLIDISDHIPVGTVVSVERPGHQSCNSLPTGSEFLVGDSRAQVYIHENGHVNDPLRKTDGSTQGGLVGQAAAVAFEYRTDLALAQSVSPRLGLPLLFGHMLRYFDFPASADHTASVFNVNAELQRVYSGREDSQSMTFAHNAVMALRPSFPSFADVFRFIRGNSAGTVIARVRAHQTEVHRGLELTEQDVLAAANMRITEFDPLPFVEFSTGRMTDRFGSISISNYCASHEAYGIQLNTDLCTQIYYRNGLRVSLTYSFGPYPFISVIATNLDGPYDSSGRFDPESGRYAYHAGVLLMHDQHGITASYFNGVTQPSVTLTVRGDTGVLVAHMRPPGFSRCLTSRSENPLDGDAVRDMAATIVRAVLDSLSGERSRRLQIVTREASSVLRDLGF